MPNRLRQEQERLYANRASGEGVRALILEVAQPGAWNGAVAVWQAVQDEWQLPAPALAVSGVDAFQLWFSLDEPVPVSEGLHFLDGLRTRFLAAHPREAVRLFTGIAQGEEPGTLSVTAVPQQRAQTGQWSAFVLPNLGALFADEPWLDIEPGPDAQADLLLRLTGITPQEFARALGGLQPVNVSGVATTAMTAANAAGAPTGRADTAPRRPDPTAAPQDDPRAFLLSVMNDPDVALSLRIEAARALLPYSEGPQTR